MTSIPLLELDRLTWKRNGKDIIKDVSFNLYKGDILTLIGPNGSGKTTLLKCIAGIAGTLVGLRKGAGTTQAYVGHTNGLKLSLTVHQNLAYQTGAPLGNILGLLAETPLKTLAYQKIDHLSAGQRRQAALMRLPLSKAPLWLIDEPLSHLDETATTWFWKTLKAHVDQGGAAVVTSHIPIPIAPGKALHLHG